MQSQFVGGGVVLVARVNAADACVISTPQRCRGVGLFPAIARAGALPRAALLAGVSLAALAMLAPHLAHAVDGTWTGGGAPAPNEWTQDNNWTSAAVPDNTATFTNNAAPTSVTISNDASINTMLFTTAAPAFNFTTSGTGITFNVNGTGIVNNSAFAPSFINNDNLNFNSASSAGNLAIINNNGGVVSFNNNSTAANATITTNNGALTQFNDNSTAGDAAIINNNGGMVSFNNNSTAGNATITTNNGALTQFNDNSTAGDAAIINNNGGMVSFNNNSTAGNATITTNNGALTQFNDNSTGGNGHFKTNAGGIVDFSNTAGPAGDGNISAGSIAGAGNYFLGSNQLTVGSNNLSTTVSGVISDCGPTGSECSAGSGAAGGGLTKVGSGTLTLAGANTYTGPTLVNGGILNVTGSLISAVTVNSGGILTGIGTIGGLDVASGGTVAPGNSIGTLSVAGDVTFEQGSIYQVKANAAGQSDKLTSSGSATISGGTVQVLAQSGPYLRQTGYTILTASGGVSGTFTGATSNLAFLTPVLSYDPNDVFLTLMRNDITFASVAQTRNQRALAEALDRSPPLDPLVQAVANLTPAGTLQAFDALSGEVHASAQATIIDDSRYVRQAILGRLRQAPYEGGAGAMATLGVGGPMLAYADHAADGALVHPKDYSPAYPINTPLGSPAQSPDLTFWAQGVGAWGKINSDGNAADVSRNLGGVFTGFDRRFGDWRAGLAAGYTNSSVSVPARASSANIDTGYFAAYGGASVGAWNVRLGGVFAWNTIATSRSIVFPGFAEQASVRYGAAESQVFGELGYGVDFGNAAVEPFAGLAWVHLNTDNFMETGGVSALSGSSNTDDVGYSTLGARWATNYLMPNGMVLTPRASLAWQHAFGAVTPSAALGFGNTGTAFGIWGVPFAGDAALVEAGGDLQLTAQTKLGVFYAGQLAANVRDHSVKGNFTGRFADGPPVMPIKAPNGSPSYYDWTGFYVGGHLGYGWGRSNWTEMPDGISDSFSLAKPFDAFQNTGSYFAGLQAGYDYMLPNRLLVGVVVDASAPSFPNLDGISIGGSSLFTSPSLGAQTYSETMLIFGTARGRVGYAPGDWLLYATGGYAWTYNQSVVNQLGSGPTDSPFLWRVGWVAGGGVEFPVAPHWTASLEYLYTHYGHAGTFFPNAGQAFDSDFSMQQLRLGLNYRFGDVPREATLPVPTMPDPDLINFHGQATLSGQGYPSFRSPYEGTNSLPGVSRPREIFDATLYAGLRLWQGAELWVAPEIDEGHGLAHTHGVAGFTSAEAYKVGFNYPYARIPRAFVRQTIDLGGNSEKVDADISQFAGTQTANRLVLTVGKFAVVDIFDTNKYANSPKLDFLNWSHVQNGTFDYAADGWGYTYGAAAEWYQGRWTLRGGVFDLSKTPTGGISPDGINLDSSFHQFQLVGEVEERHELWGQPGKIKITGFLSRGRAGDFADAVAVAQATGQPADINSVRVYRSRPGVSVNLEQQVSEFVGIFARAGWADGNVEPWDFTDIDRAVSGGVWLSGNLWGRQYDSVGVAATVNGISSIHQQFFNLGGLGILIGDGQLPNPGLERIIELYYSYAFTPATRVTFDYQFITNPAYNTDRGPVSVFGMRLHAQF